jgi:hypothetical protein
LLTKDRNSLAAVFTTSFDEACKEMNTTSTYFPREKKIILKKDKK